MRVEGFLVHAIFEADDLDCRAPRAELEQLRAGLRDFLLGTAVPTIEAWLEQAAAQGAGAAVCVRLHAHLAYAQRNTRAAELDAASTGDTLGHIAYFMKHHAYTQTAAAEEEQAEEGVDGVADGALARQGDASTSATLWVPEHELFELVHAQRRDVITQFRLFGEAQMQEALTKVLRAVTRQSSVSWRGCARPARRLSPQEEEALGTLGSVCPDRTRAELLDALQRAGDVQARPALLGYWDTF